MLKNLLLAQRGALLRYAAAALLASTALALAGLLGRLEGRPLSSIAMVAVVLSAVYGGMGPALFAAGISAVGIDYLFVEPIGSVFTSWAAVFRVLAYGAVGFMVARIVASLRAAYRELYAQYRQTEQAKRARENMLAVVAHDLRSPLTAALLGITYVKRAVREGATTGELAGALDAVHRAADSMKRLVEDLLDAAAIEAGRLRLAPHPERLAPIVEAAAETARFAAEPKHIRMEASVPDGRCAALVDRERMMQVLGNLIGNAIKFSPEGSLVRVALHETDEAVQIDVTDSGPGIAENDAAKLFSPYWQAAETAHLGTGLGLFIARSLVEAQNGRIEVRSAKGSGATFSVILPRLAAPG